MVSQRTFFWSYHFKKSLLLRCMPWVVDFVLSVLGRFIRRPVSPNLGLNFYSGLFFFSSKAFSLKIFSILCRVANRQIVDKRIKLNLLLKLSYLNSNFGRTLGYLNPALKNPAMVIWGIIIRFSWNITS